jgi:hypothetical protein
MVKNMHILDFLLKSPHPSNFDEEAAACMIGIAVVPGMLQDVSPRLRAHPLIVGASLLSDPEAVISEDQAHQVNLWFLEHSAEFRRPTPGSFDTPMAAMVLERARTMLPDLVRRIGRIVPDIYKNKELAISACRQDPLILLDFSEDVKMDTRVLRKALGYASQRLDGSSLPRANEIGAFLLWDKLPASVIESESGLTAFREQLEREILFASPELEAARLAGTVSQPIELGGLPQTTATLHSDKKSQEILLKAGLSMPSVTRSPRPI